MTRNIKGITLVLSLLVFQYVCFGQTVSPCGVSVAETHTDLVCAGDSVGTITLKVTGGAPGYRYLWSTGDTDKDLTNLTAGIYNVIVKDSLNCTAKLDVMVYEPSPMVLTTTQTKTSCPGMSDASAQLKVKGGTPPYKYFWSTGPNTPDIDHLSTVVDAYVVTVFDASGCTASASVSIQEPTSVSLTTATTKVFCAGGKNGTITLKEEGGTPPYSYKWSNGSTTENQDSVSAGFYTVTVTDHNGCSASSSATVTELPSLIVSSSSFDVSCAGGKNGLIDISVTGGTPGYKYKWSNGMTTEDLSKLKAGLYTLTVSDAYKCIATTSVNISETPAMVVTATGNKINVAGGKDGAITLSVYGGTSGFTYKWSNGLTDSNPVGLVAGKYDVTVTDANECTATATATITQPAPLKLKVVATNVTCNGSKNGSVDLTVTGGVVGYSYLWSNGEINEDIAALPVGKYTVTVTDLNNISATASATVTEPTEITMTEKHTDVVCAGGSNGKIDITVKGGVPPYTYGWSHGITKEDAIGLPAGSYIATVTDANGCTNNITVMINEPTPITLSDTKTRIGCAGGNNGGMAVTASGGAPPYLYKWSNGYTTDVLSNLAAGNYKVTVSDASGCTATMTSVIEAPTPVSLSISATKVKCSGGSDGSINLNVSGGSQPYSYSWNNGRADEDPTGLPADNYTVSVSDANGCIATAAITVEQPSVVIAAVEISGTAMMANGFGGTPPYRYVWGNGFAAQSISNPANGFYAMTITDSQNCTDTMSLNVAMVDGQLQRVGEDLRNRAPSALNTSKITNLEAFDIVPNPSTGNITVSTVFTNVERTDLEIYNPKGRLVYKEIRNGVRSTFPIKLDNKDKGEYLVVIHTGLGSISRKLTIK